MKRILIIVLSLLMVLSLAGCKSSDYKRAVELYNEKDYAEAQTIFDSLQNYKDSEEYSKKCNDELQYALVNNPAEEDVIARLKTVPGILAIETATEDNDPNGMLHKQGSYTAAIYFQYNKVSDEHVLEVIRDYGVIEAGTEAGGQIEVYASEADAIKRNTYLSTFDGTFLASGSHTVIGTCVVRTSNCLTASQQKELEAMLIDALIKID